MNTPLHHLAITAGIFVALYSVSLAREWLRQRRICRCKPTLSLIGMAAAGEAFYAFSGETILYYLTLN